MRFAIVVSVVIAAGAGFALQLAAAPSLPSNLQVMPLGDSITFGACGTRSGYRGPLYDRLSAIAPNVQFVGASTAASDALPANGQHHNGYSSYATLDLSNNLDGLDTRIYDRIGSGDRDPNGGYWLTGGHDTGRSAVFPDVVLLLVGANDNAVGDPRISPALYQTNLTTLVDKIVTLRPDVRLIMAHITPFYDQISTATAMNNAVDAVAAQYLALGKHVSVADLNTSFPSNGMSSDGVHPNDVGYAWMADQWYGAIRTSYAGVPEPGTLGMLTVAVLGAAAFSTTSRWWRGQRTGGEPASESGIVAR